MVVAGWEEEGLEEEGKEVVVMVVEGLEEEGQEVVEMVAAGWEEEEEVVGMVVVVVVAGVVGVEAGENQVLVEA